MRFFDTDMQKTSKGIINALNLKESAASVKAQIHKDEPEEAPKETKEALVKKVQSPKIPTKQALKEDITDIQNQIAELQDYLNNTPDISEDERASIQAEIDELLDEVNFYDAGLDMEVEEPSEDDLHLGESEELTEAPNPENEDLNKKILATIRAKSDVEPKYYDDFQASISDKLAELKARVDRAKATKANDLATADRAAARKQEILDKARAKRNQ